MLLEYVPRSTQEYMLYMLETMFGNHNPCRKRSQVYTKQERKTGSKVGKLQVCFLLVCVYPAETSGSVCVQYKYQYIHVQVPSREPSTGKQQTHFSKIEVQQVGQNRPSKLDEQEDAQVQANGCMGCGFVQDKHNERGPLVRTGGGRWSSRALQSVFLQSVFFGLVWIVEREQDICVQHA